MPADDRALGGAEQVAHRGKQHDGIKIAVHDVQRPTQARTDENAPLIRCNIAIPLRFIHALVSLFA